MWITKLLTFNKPRRGTSTKFFITTRGRVKEAFRCVIAGCIQTIFKNANIIVSPESCRATVNSDNWINRTHDLDEFIKHSTGDIRTHF